MAKKAARKPSPETPTLTRLGKIKSVEFGGLGSGKDIGLTVALVGTDFHFNIEERAPNGALVPEGETPSWVHEDLQQMAVTILDIAGVMLRDSGKRTGPVGSPWLSTTPSYWGAIRLLLLTLPPAKRPTDAEIPNVCRRD